MRHIFKIITFCCVLLSAHLHAELLIEITSGNDQAAQLAVSPFSWKGTKVLPEDMAAIVDNDLTLSGLFKAVPRTSMLSFPTKASEVDYQDWGKLGTSYVVTGQVGQVGNSYEVNYQLFDVTGKRQIDQGGFRGTKEQLRELAHRVSDAVYEKVTGLEGDFSTRILYVTAQRHNAERTDYQLNYADSDGKGQRIIFRSSEPVLSPSWSPDGEKVAYTSFEKGRPAIYIQELTTGKRQKITGFKGLNSSPVWSPDGKAMAMVLSKSGNPDVYVLDMKTNKISNVSNHYAIDTEPDWMPDSQSLIFTSNRGGGAQIYQQAVQRESNGAFVPVGKTKRLTYTGKFNARAKVLPDGQSLAVVHKGNGATDYNIAILDLNTSRLNKLTSSKLEDSPSVAPGGRRLIYSVQGGKNGELGIVSVDGRIKQRLPSAVGDVREPAWGPIIKPE